MSEFCETSFCELRKKEVVNAADGKRLGRIIDIIFSIEPNCVQGIVVPFGKFSLFSKQQNVFIPFTCINKIGQDIILVDIISDADGNLLCKTRPEHGFGGEHREHEIEREIEHERHEERREERGGGLNCDHRCEKCMLFDCEHRWQHV